MKLSVDMEKCIMAGECRYNHPELFELGDDGYPVLPKTEITSDSDILAAEQAAEVCPAQAIVLKE